MNKNQRTPKLPFCKKVRLALHLETEYGSLISQERPWHAQGRLTTQRLLTTQPLSAPTVPACASELHLLGKCWNKPQLSELSSASRQYFQESNCIY